MSSTSQAECRSPMTATAPPMVSDIAIHSAARDRKSQHFSVNLRLGSHVSRGHARFRPMNFRSEVRERLAAEQGTVRKHAPERVALCYPSPYRVGMSSLGFQS